MEKVGTMLNKKLKIAITGGIGSGKSTVSEIIRKKGYPVFSCDEIYKELQSEPNYLDLLEISFGNVVRNGVLDRKALASLVFNNKERLAKLNSLAHPLIMQRLYKKMEAYPVSFAEIPLLFESGRQNDFERIIVVYRNLEKRIDAVCVRDNVERDSVNLRIKNQVDYEKIIKEGHTVIYNDGDLESLEKKVTAVLEKIIF